jgi:hypothetical protein
MEKIFSPEIYIKVVDPKKTGRIQFSYIYCCNTKLSNGLVWVPVYGSANKSMNNNIEDFKKFKNYLL